MVRGGQRVSRFNFLVIEMGKIKKYSNICINKYNFEMRSKVYRRWHRQDDAENMIKVEVTSTS